MTADVHASALRRCLEDRSVWFEGLPKALAGRRWSLLGLDDARDLYGTDRALAGDAERVVAGTVPWATVHGPSRRIIVETLQAGPGRRYVDLGLNLAGPEFAGSGPCLDRLVRSLRVLSADQSAASVVDAVLWAVHVLRPEGPDYDVSYSDPAVPFSVFVGVPDVDVRHGDLRLAEGILHECLHLLLTLVEDVVPLVTGAEESHFSPWQGTMRPTQGVLHGAYVFALLGDAFGRLARSEGLSPSERGHLTGRVATCDDEVATATASLLAGGELTGEGRMLVEALATMREGRRIGP